MNRTRKLLPRLLGAAALTAALVAAITAFSGLGSAQTAAQVQYAPRNQSPPTIHGTPQVGQTLTATTGSWTSDVTPTFAFQWQRCNAQGASCVDIANATAQTYAVQQADTGNTLRVKVTASNPSGSSTATSQQTAVVTTPAPQGPAGAIKLQNGKTSIPASSVALPARLIIDGVASNPRRLVSRDPFTLRVHVSDTRGFVVREALVYAIGLPYNWARSGVELRTGTDGWASLQLQPTRAFPRNRAMVIFLRARVAGQDLLGGVSTRRLVQVTSA